MIRVVTVDHDDEFRKELASELDKQPEFTVVGEFLNPDSAGATRLGLIVGVVVTEIRSPRESRMFMRHDVASAVCQGPPNSSWNPLTPSRPNG